MSPFTEAPIRVGVLGAGAIAQIVHLPIFSERDDVELSVVGDVDVHKLRALAERFSADAVEGDALLDDERIDAVVIATPNHLHEEQAVAALRAGKHVLVERPLALTPEGVERIERAAAEAGKAVVVGMSHRFRPDASALASIVAGGELGNVYAGHVAWLNRKVPVQRTPWRLRKSESGGGALVDLGVPALDLGLWLVGYPPVERVQAALGPDAGGVEVGGTVFVQAEGLAITVEVSWTYFAGEDRRFARVMGSEGSGSLPPLQIYKQLGGRPLDVTPRQPRPRGGENPYMNAYRREIDHFLRVVAGERHAPFPAEQARLMALVQAAYRSAEEGREITL